MKFIEIIKSQIKPVFLIGSRLDNKGFYRKRLLHKGYEQYNTYQDGAGKTIYCHFRYVDNNFEIKDNK